MLALTLAHCAFTPPPLSGVAMASGRRAFLGRAFLGAATAGAAASTLVIAPLPSFAVASAQQVLKSRAVYGSRVFRLQDASAAVIMDEKNVFDLFLTGVYGSTADKATRKALQKLETVALAAAAKGDAATAHVAIKEFVTLGQITEMDQVKGTTFNPKTACDRPGLQCGKGYEGYVGSRMLD